MHKLARLLSVLVLVTLGLSGIAVFSQSSASTLEVTSVNPSNAPQIVLSANLTDRNNTPFSGLSLNDFTLRGELASVARLVSVEEITTETPLAVVLTLDVSSSMAGTPIESAKIAAKLFVDGLAENDQAAIVAFNDTERLIQDFTSDKDLLKRQIDALAFGGQTALYDASVLTAETASAAPFSRRAAILLSDGAEFGNASANSRTGALESAVVRGVTTYTIGLGFGIDRSFLQQVAETSNGQFFESPTPEELQAIYSELSQRFRSQYVITLETNADVPLDGTSYVGELIANPPQGESNPVALTVRLPIPVPILRLPTGIFEQALSEVTPVTVELLSDEETSPLGFAVDGEAVTPEGEAGNRITLDPFLLSAGDHQLTVNVVDASGDASRLDAPFSVASLAPRLSEVTLSEGQSISEPVMLDASASVQAGTRLEAIEVQIGDEPAQAVPVSLDPYDYQDGTLPIRFIARDAQGGTSEQALTLEIAALAPIIQLSELPSEIRDEQAIPVTVSIQSQATPIVRYALLPTGSSPSEETWQAAAQTSTGREAAFQIEAETLTNGDYVLFVEAQQSNGQTSQVSADLRINKPVSTAFIQTATAQAQGTANAIANATSTAGAIANATSTAQAQSTIDAIANTTSTAQAQQAATQQAEQALTSTLQAQQAATQQAEQALTSTLQAQQAATQQAAQTATQEVQQASTSTAQANATSRAVLGATIAARSSTNQTATAEYRITQSAITNQTATAETDAIATAFARGVTSTAQARQSAQTATAEVRASQTAVIQATLQAQETGTAQVQATQQAQVTGTAQAQLNAIASATAIQENLLQTATEAIAQATSDARGTATTIALSATPTETPLAPTFTPVGGINTVESDAPPATPDIAPIALLIGAALLLLILLILILRGRSTPVEDADTRRPRR